MSVANEVFTESASADTLIGEQVRFWLFRRGLNQADLAAGLGLSIPTTSRKLAGKTAWSVTDLARAAAILNVDITDLFRPEVIANEQKKMASTLTGSKPQVEPPVRLELTTYALQERCSTN